MLARAEVAQQIEDARIKVLISLDALAKSTFEVLDAIPLTPVGKIDKKVIRAQAAI